MGFVPFTEAELLPTGEGPENAVGSQVLSIEVAEHEGKTIGFALAVPDINQVLIKIRKGRLLPTGIIKLLTGMKRR